MSFNNGNERRMLNAKWEHLRVQYREAGMSKEAIQAMYEFDLDVLNGERAYDANTVAVCDGDDDKDARKAADVMLDTPAVSPSASFLISDSSTTPCKTLNSIPNTSKTSTSMSWIVALRQTPSFTITPTSANAYSMLFKSA